VFLPIAHLSKFHFEIFFDRPRAGTLAPSPPSFPRLGPPFCGRVQSLRWVQGAFKFRPLDFGPLDKDDAVPRVRKADGGKAMAARAGVGTLYNRR
jgi:hypothetical protein